MTRRSVAAFQARRDGAAACVVPLNPDPDDVPTMDLETLWAEFFRVGDTLARADLGHLARRLLTRRIAAISAELARRRRRQP